MPVNPMRLYLVTNFEKSAMAHKICRRDLAIIETMDVCTIAQGIGTKRLAQHRQCNGAPLDFSLSTRKPKRNQTIGEKKRQRRKRLLLDLTVSLVSLSFQHLKILTRIKLSTRYCQALVLVIGLLITANGPALDSLERLHQMGVLKAAINQPTEVHSSNLHPSNILIEVLQAFAAEQQVGLELITLNPKQAPPDTLDILATDHAHYDHMRFTRPVMTIDRFLVHHKSTPESQLPPTTQAIVNPQSKRAPLTQQYLTNDTPNAHHQPPNSQPPINATSNFVANKSADNRATGKHLFNNKHADLQTAAGQPVSIFNLFDQISVKKVPYVLALSHEYEVYRHFVEDLTAKPIDSAHTFRWGLNKMQSVSLFSAAEHFIETLHESGEIHALKARFFWNNAALNALERHIFLKRVHSRLPKYITAFKAAGEKHNLDWRLLAAMSYQESHWNAQAVSPTGVRGLMMLTQAAAKEVGITDRSRPDSSIHGGAAYFKKQKARLPEFIPEPDRTWMALAAYNLGMRTVLRAIKRTQKHGSNPTDWFEVQKHLSAFEKDIPTRAGIKYRKGADQGLHYVKHIRLFYDLLQHPNLLDNKSAPQPINLAMARNPDP